jgi:hypothetical protein
MQDENRAFFVYSGISVFIGDWGDFCGEEVLDICRMDRP